MVPAFGTWRKDSECSSVAEDSSIPDPSLEGLSYAFQQARLARVVSRKEESAERPVLTAEVSHQHIGAPGGPLPCIQAYASSGTIYRSQAA